MPIRDAAADGAGSASVEAGFWGVSFEKHGSVVAEWM